MLIAEYVFKYNGQNKTGYLVNILAEYAFNSINEHKKYAKRFMNQ